MIQTWIDGFFFVTAYSNFPLYVVLHHSPFVGHYLVLEHSFEPMLRYLLWNTLGILFFIFIHTTNLRRQYMFWHLDKRRKLSGLIPIEIAVATFYHSLYLCFLTEILICLLDGSFLQYYSPLWVKTTTNRIVDIFFTSLCFHIGLETTGWNDHIRIGYYTR